MAKSVDSALVGAANVLEAYNCPLTHGQVLEARATVERMAKALEQVNRVGKWWADNQDSPKSALSHFSDAAAEARAALAAYRGES